VSKVALVTGAARGIGLATANRFLEEGWKVVMIDRDGEELRKVSKPMVNAFAIVADVSKSEDVNAFMTEVDEQMGRLDALVNNAGVADFGPIEETTFERWRDVMATNLDGVFLVSQAAIRLLKMEGGAIVNIASGFHASHRLWHFQGRRDPADIAAGCRAWRVSHPGKLRLPRSRAHQTCHGGSHAGYH